MKKPDNPIPSVSLEPPQFLRASLGELNEDQLMLIDCSPMNNFEAVLTGEPPKPTESPENILKRKLASEESIVKRRRIGPPSFERGEKKRTQDFQKITEIERYIIECQSGIALQRDFTEEELEILKLLLNGVSPADILNGTRLMPIKEERDLDLDSTIITEADMGDEELSEYLLTEAEIAKRLKIELLRKHLSGIADSK